jgi:hypothetical protein
VVGPRIGQKIAWLAAVPPRRDRDVGMRSDRAARGRAVRDGGVRQPLGALPGRPGGRR